MPIFVLVTGIGCVKCTQIHGFNPRKTSMVILNYKSKPGEEISIKIENEVIKQEKSAKLLTFDENQGWKTHIYGTGGLISQLNKRLFAIRRL